MIIQAVNQSLTHVVMDMARDFVVHTKRVKYKPLVK